jgi:hypothetical protein
VSAEEVEEQCVKLAKKGMRPSAIGVTLRDSQGIPMVGAVTGSKILRILKKNGNEWQSFCPSLWYKKRSSLRFPFFQNFMHPSSSSTSSSPSRNQQAWRLRSLRTFTSSSRKP